MGIQTIHVRTSVFVASANTAVDLETTSLGSCVAVALYDAEAKVGGLCHCLLDRSGRFGPVTEPGRCADTAIPALVQEMVALGAHQDRLTARIAGGGNMFSTRTLIYDVGVWNVDSARETLSILGIQIIGEDVGGGAARRLRLSMGSGLVTVQKPNGSVEVI